MTIFEKMKKRETEEVAQVLRERLWYEPETGRLYWREDRHNSARAGKEAGSITTHYRMVGCMGKGYMAHRIVWMLYYGEWPRGVVVHLNKDCSDNRIENLRGENDTGW